MPRRAKPLQPAATPGASACLACEEAGETYCRGLCRPCYSSAWEVVRSGLRTWEQLETARACLPPSRAARRARFLGGAQ